MRLRDYFVGKSFCLQSPLSPRTVAERINAAAGSTLWPFNDGVVGGVRLGSVRLRFRSSFAEYNAKPVLAGRLREGRSGSVLSLRYRAPYAAHLFDIVWYGGLALLALGLVFGEVNPDLTWGDWALLCAGYVAFLVAPVVLHYFGTRNSDAELTYLLDFLAEHAEAKPQILL
jgi:hypothetical protein